MMSPIGLKQFQDFVPLPLSENEDVSFYYFLAQASIRKLLMETLDIVGYRSKPSQSVVNRMVLILHQAAESYTLRLSPRRFATP
jgi:hypothetical protein